jgi:ribosome-binding factor A
VANPRTLRRLESRIKERAAYCLQFEIKDPRSSLLTVTRVELAPDLTRGTIFYSCLGSPTEQEKSRRMIESAAGFIQRKIARVLETRTTPHLEWEYDDSIGRASELDRLISDARERDDELGSAFDRIHPAETTEDAEDR